MAEKDSNPKTKKSPAVAKTAASSKGATKAASTVKPADKATKPVAAQSKAKSEKSESAKQSAAQAKKQTAPKSESSKKDSVKSNGNSEKSLASNKAQTSTKEVNTANKTTSKSAGGGKNSAVAAQENKRNQNKEIQSETQPYEKSKDEKTTTAGGTTKKSSAAASVYRVKTVKSKASNNGAASAAISSKKIKMIAIPVVSALLVIALIVGIVLGTKLNKKSNSPFNPFTDSMATQILPSTQVNGDNPLLDSNNSANSIVLPSDNTSNGGFKNEYANTSAVGYSSKILGTVERVKPVTEVKDGGLPSGYPKYGYTLSGVIGSDDDKVAARDALIAESDLLVAKGTRTNSGNGNHGEASYTWMDKDGFLYSGTTSQPVNAVYNGVHRQLYEHTAAKGMYLGDVSDDEPRIVKEVSLRPRGYGSYSVTGLYAPAGEVIKIEISEADMNATGGITIHIGQALYNGQANNIWTAKGQMQRFPVILNTMSVTKDTATLKDGVYTAYVGSFVGGPLYIRNTLASFTAKISGCVTYSHFILGSTTKEEFEENATSSAPYFDLEVWSYGVLHSGPKAYAKNFSYDDLYKAAVLWEKVSSVTTTGSNQGIVFLYDAFVAAGAAVAFPGRSSVNCPMGWMAGSLNYNAIVSSGSWGNFHEYHHNFQGYGVGNGGEVTNNGMTLVSYALFTKISAKRGLGSYGAEGLGGWNNYTSATLALEETLKIARPDQSPSNGDQGLALYATLLHNFGANNYIQAKYQQQSHGYGQSYVGYMRAWQDITHNNMSYFFKDVLQGIDTSAAGEWGRPDYPMFVPVSSIYQTGRSYIYDGEKKYFQTMQPYVIPYGADYNIDLSKYTLSEGQYVSGSIVIPDGFSYRIKSITSPAHGSIEIIDDYKFKFKPDSANLRSGQIIVTLQIVKNDKAFKVDDVDLVLEFEQSHETNKTTLTRTTYTYTADNMYTDAQEAYNNGYRGYTAVKTSNHSNPTQNCNTDIWYLPNDAATHEKFPNAPQEHFVPENTVVELSGKIYFQEAGTYRMYLRGRMNCAAYFSLDGGRTYLSDVATIKDTAVLGGTANFRPNNSATYVDIEMKEGSWLYFKSVLIVQPSPMVSYMGLGMAKWTDPMFTMVEKFYDKDGNELESKDDEAYHHSKTHYYDYQGTEVTEEEANDAKPIPPTSSPTYVNAYRLDYEFPSNSDFETDYFYKRTYSYTYSEVIDDSAQSIVSSVNSAPNYPIGNLIDGNPDTMASSATIVSAANPWEITVDLGKVITANRFVLTGNKFNNNSTKNQTPNSLTLYVGETLDNMQPAFSVEKGNVNDVTFAYNFTTADFRYYKLVVTGTPEGRYAAIKQIKFSNSITGGNQFSPDKNAFTFNGSWDIESANSTFGHIFVGDNNATVSFKFNGSRLAILSSNLYGKDFMVTIDGKVVNSIELKQDSSAFGAAYISKLLDNDNHSVEIKCLNKASIDSIVVFN